MASAASSDGLFRSICEGCIPCYDSEIERRPYHRNCSCALHDARNRKCPHGRASKSRNVSYPMRRSWSEGSCLSLMASSGSRYSSPSPSSSPSMAWRPQSDVISKEEKEEDTC